MFDSEWQDGKDMDTDVFSLPSAEAETFHPGGLAGYT